MGDSGTGGARAESGETSVTLIRGYLALALLAMTACAPPLTYRIVWIGPNGTLHIGSGALPRDVCERELRNLSATKQPWPDGYCFAVLP